MSTHSRFSASGAERWMACPGSIPLAEGMGLDSEESSYAAEGSAAHELAAKHLRAGTDVFGDIGMFVYGGRYLVTATMAEHVQFYLDTVRAFPGVMTVEERVEGGDLGDDLGGTLDCALAELETGLDNKVFAGILRIFDLKYGAGIAVEIENNAQLWDYAFLKLRVMKLLYGPLPDDLVVELTIVQPRAFHVDGPVRSQTVFAKDIFAWGERILTPALERARDSTELDQGLHCRFCPAKLKCPAFLGEIEQALDGKEIKTMDDKELGKRYVSLPLLRMYSSALEAEILKRMTAGKAVPGAKLVAKRSDRAWKTGADAAALLAFGDDCMSAPALLSPAALEQKLGSAAKSFTKRYTYKPDAGTTLAPETDKRPATKAEPLSETFKNVKVGSQPTDY